MISFKEFDLILNIGSGSVSGGIVEFRKPALPAITHIHESLFPIKDNPSADKLASHMLSAVHTVVGRLHKDHKGKIQAVHVTFSSPWFSSFSKSLTIKREAPFTVTNKTIENLVAEHLGSILKEISENKHIILEKTISHVRLNGYETANPHGQSAKTLDVSVYASTIPPIVKEEIESEIYTVIHPEVIRFHSFPFVAWNVVEHLFSPKEDFIFIDVGSEVTDTLVVKNGSIHSITSFPMGKNHIVRKLSVSQNTEPELALSLINLLVSDSLETSQKDKISSLVKAMGEEWGLHFSHVIQDPTNHSEHFSPQKAFFVTDQDVSKIFSDIIHNQIPNVIPLSRENLSAFVGFSKAETPNFFIALEAIYLNSLK